MFGGEATDLSRRVLGSTDAGSLTKRGLTWRADAPGAVGGPEPRSWAGACVVAGTHERPVGVLQGGRSARGAALDDAWVLDPRKAGNAWQKLATVGGKPAGRFFHTLTAVGGNARTAVCIGGMGVEGGGDPVPASEDLWVLDLSPAFVYSVPRAPDADDEAAGAPAPAAEDEPASKGGKPGKKGGAKVDKKKAKEDGRKSVAKAAAPDKRKAKAAAPEPEKKAAPAVWTKLARFAPRVAMHVSVGWAVPLPDDGAEQPVAGEKRCSAVFALLVWGGTAADGSATGAKTLEVAAERVVAKDGARGGYLENFRWSDAGFADLPPANTNPDQDPPPAPCGAAAVHVDVAHAPGVYVCGGARRSLMSPAKWRRPSSPRAAAESRDGGCPSVWLQTGPHLANFASRRLAREILPPPEEPDPPVAEGWGRQNAEDGSVYEGQFVEGLRSGTGRCVYAGAGGTYEGEWKLDKRHGVGKWTGPGRDHFGECSYEGEWRGDERNGKATSAYEDGAVFEGDYVDDHRHYGTLRLANGDVYVGGFDVTGRAGHGECTYKDTAVYVGAWRTDLRHGHGEHLYADGSKYAGEWHGGRRNGAGECRFANRDVYEGKWVADRRCGRGGCVYASGARYAGEWRDDERNGTGSHTDANGTYEGGWADDRAHGIGSWTGINRPDYEKEYVGEWRAGGRHGDGAAKYLDASRYSGAFRDDGRFRGVLTFANGDVYEGDFKNHKRDGDGHQSYANGGDYRGQWRRGMRDGVGDYALRDVEKYSGEWARDLRHGNGTWAGTRPEDREVSYAGDWADDKRSGPAKSADADGATFEGDYVADVRSRGVLDLANGDVYEGHFAISGRHGLGECAYATGGVFVGEWAHDKPETDKGKWTGVVEVQKLATTYKGQTSKRGFFSRSTGKKYAIGEARVAPF